MSLKFSSIEVKDYFSLDKAKLKFTPGIFLIEGENRDLPNFEELVNQGASVSNGSGKTTLFSAPYQCLFNKNSKDSKATIASVGNLYTNKPYNIALKFTKGTKHYEVENNRAHNKIFIKEDGVDITPKGVANQLTLIKNIIGFDFSTFSSLTFLNQQSLSNIIDLTNKDNVVYQFFDIEKLNSLEKELKVRKKSKVEARNMIVSNLSVVRKHLALVEGFSKVDLKVLDSQEASLNANLLELELKENTPKLKIIKSKLSNLKVTLGELRVELGGIAGSAKVLKAQAEKLSSGTCPTCNQSVASNSKAIEDELEVFRKEYKVVNTKIFDCNKEISTLEEDLHEELGQIEEAKKIVLQQINQVRTKILLGKDNNERYDKSKDNIQELENERDLLETEAPLVDEDIKVLEALLAVLKSGAVVNEYLKKYRLLFLRNFRELKKYTSFDIDILIKVEKGKMSYNFFDAGKEKSFHSLSAGERTRVSLMLLLATLKTIEQLTNITINYLVLDELLGVLDHEGITFLEKVLDDMRKTKSIYIITHHNEIKKEYADGIIKVVRENNLSVLEDA